MINHDLLKRRGHEKIDIQNDLTWLEYIIGWNTGEQAQVSQQRFGPKIVDNEDCEDTAIHGISNVWSETYI